MKKINFGELLSDNPKVKYGCTKKIISLSKENPNRLYPEINSIIKLLDNKNLIIKWTGILAIGNLSKVDKKNKIDKLFLRFINFLNSGNMITANNTILALTEIALNKPKYLERIIKELLKVEKNNYDTTECRNIVIGKAILTFGTLKSKIKNKKEVVDFLQRQTKNTRNATKKKAQELLKKID